MAAVPAAAVFAEAATSPVLAAGGGGAMVGVATLAVAGAALPGTRGPDAGTSASVALPGCVVAGAGTAGVVAGDATFAAGVPFGADMAVAPGLLLPRRVCGVTLPML